MRICYFGTYERDYPRNSIFIEGLKQNGVEVFECHAPLWEKTQTKGKDFGSSPAFVLSFILSQIRLFFKYIFIIPKHDIIVVGYIGHLDIYLAKLLSFFGRKKLVFNPLISLFDTVISDRGYFDESSLKSKLFYFLDRTACKLSDMVFLDTNAHIQYFKETLDLNNIRFKRIPVGADDNVFRPFETQSNPKFTVMFVGKFIPLHGIEKIIETAVLLKSSEEIQFVLIGKGQLRESVEIKISEMSLGNVQLIDWILYDSLAEEMSKADLLLGIFGDSEKARRVIPNKLYQALAVKKPILTAETDALKELLIPGEQVFACDPTPEKMAKKIVEIKDNPLERERVAQQGYHNFQDRLSVNKLGSLVKDSLAEL